MKAHRSNRTWCSWRPRETQVARQANDARVDWQKLGRSEGPLCEGVTQPTRTAVLLLVRPYMISGWNSSSVPIPSVADHFFISQPPSQMSLLSFLCWGDSSCTVHSDPVHSFNSSSLPEADTDHPQGPNLVLGTHWMQFWEKMSIIKANIKSPLSLKVSVDWDRDTERRVLGEMVTGSEPWIQRRQESGMDLASTHLFLPCPSSLCPHSKAANNSGVRRQKMTWKELCIFCMKSTNRKGREWSLERRIWGADLALDSEDGDGWSSEASSPLCPRAGERTGV